MNKKLCLVLLVIFITVITSFSGCTNKEISFYLGTSKTAENNTKLDPGKTVTVEQSKEKIENSKLVFNKNKDKNFDNMYLCFKGNSIKSVVAKSKNKTILYDNYNKVTRLVDVFDFYYPVDKSKLDDSFKPEINFEFKWDGGEFDEIRNVYFDGMTYNEITRTRSDPSKIIAGAEVYLWNEGNLKDCNEFYYLDEKQKIDEPVVVVEIMKGATDPNFKKELADKSDDAIILKESVETNQNVTQDSFIYRYEKLFYNSQQSALKSKNSFDYSDLKGETVDLIVNYNDNSKETYKFNISFDNNGNINAELSAEGK